MMPKVIYGPRQSGRTTKLINLCKLMNETYGGNYAVILAKDHEDALRIRKMADGMGYPDMPFPVTLGEVVTLKGHSYYKKLLIDDLDILIQRIVGSQFEVAAYTINSEDFLDEISNMGIEE